MRTEVKDLRAGTLLRTQTFLVSEVKELETKNGKPYINLVAGDKTGSISAVWWDVALADIGIVNMLKSGGLVDLAGEISDYKGKLQFKITGVGRASTSDMTLFEKMSKYDIDEMTFEFLSLTRWFSDPNIIELSQRLINTGLSEFTHKPAATGMHHAFKHGLIEHTTQMLKTAEKLFELEFYSEALNKDYCMFGIMFHDFMKIWEYGDGPEFKKTTLGILVPHIPKIAALIEREAATMNLSEEMIAYLQSIVLSHHRFLEWGSPVKPATPEALFVHYVDNLHGDVFGTIQKLEADNTSEQIVKYGYGEQQYTLVKRRFSDVLGGRDVNRAGENSIPSGKESDLGFEGF